MSAKSTVLPARLRGTSVQTSNDATLTLANRQRHRAVDLWLLRKVCHALLAELELEPAGLEINLVDGPEIARLNETFLRHAGPTDVLAFDYGGERRASGRPAASRARPSRAAATVVKGEIFVCVDEAVRQARRYRTTWPAELLRYLIHGLLHLRGYDDAQPAPRRKMKREEDRLLRLLGLRSAFRNRARRVALKPC